MLIEGLTSTRIAHFLVGFDRELFSVCRPMT